MTAGLHIMPDRAFTTVCILAAVLIRWGVGNGSYSGMSKLPMYGDYEAQRHWQEITINIPVKQWYRNTTDNDLLYWGLDYPPLTAYHSWLLGKVASTMDNKWVALFESRGTEGYLHKLFMRCSVLFADILVYLPSLYLVNKRVKSSSLDQQGFLLSLLYPGLILIDHGHFQYNNISLGLFLLAVHFIHIDKMVFASVFFCLSLNYKQMELYHSIPFFCFLLGNAMKAGFFRGVYNVIKLGVTVLLTFGICWLPFLSNIEDIQSVLFRLFPTNRGLYEDKVASFWCAISPILKLKDIVSPSGAVRLCIIFTLLGSTASALHTLFLPKTRNFRFSCVSVSLAFFIFSFQVHEKSILIPAVSAVLLYRDCPFLSVWFLHISTFSMAPLLQKDGLLMQFFATRYLFFLVAYGWDLHASKPSTSTLHMITSLTRGALHERNVIWTSRIMVFLSLTISEVFAFLLCFVQPPEHLPDLWSWAISAYCCLHFFGFLLMFSAVQIAGESVTVL